MREAICKDLESLECLKPGTTITIIVDLFPRWPTMREIENRAASLFPVSLRMRGMGDKMIRRLCFNCEIVVERGNRWVEAWLRENK